MLLLNHEKVFILFRLFDNPVQSPDILVNLPVNKGCQKRTANLLHTFQSLIIVVQINQTGHHLFLCDLLLIPKNLRLIKQINSQHLLCPGYNGILILFIFSDIDRANIHAEFILSIGGMDM